MYLKLDSVRTAVEAYKVLHGGWFKGEQMAIATWLTNQYAAKIILNILCCMCMCLHIHFYIHVWVGGGGVCGCGGVCGWVCCVWV